MTKFNRLTKNKFNPDTLANLPSRCAVHNKIEGAWIIVIKGMAGYLSETLNEEQAQAFNLHQRSRDPLAYDPTNSAVQEAMFAGSMFGWEIPGIDPALWIKETAA